MDEIRITADGMLKLPGDVSRALSDQSLSLFSCSSDHLFLACSGLGKKFQLAGVLDEGSISDLLSFLNMFRKTGVFGIQLVDGHKKVYLQNGEIVFADSTYEEEDLGEILLFMGKVDQQTLQELRGRVSENQSLEQLLMAHKVVASTDLWLAKRNQVEHIVYNLFALVSGGFYFQQTKIDPEQCVHLSMATRNLILEGLRRLDEKTLYLRKIVSLDYYPRETGFEPFEASQQETQFINRMRVDQGTAAQLFRGLGMTELDGMKLLYALLEKNSVRMEERPPGGVEGEIEGELGRILTSYNMLFRSITEQLGDDRLTLLENVERSLRELPQPASFVLGDVGLREDGSLDGYRIVANLVGLEEGDKKKMLAEALSAVAFAEAAILLRLFDADQVDSLIAGIQEITGEVNKRLGEMNER